MLGCRLLGLGQPVLGHLDVQLGQKHAARGLVLDPAEQLADDPERRGHHSAGMAAVDPFAQDVDLEPRAGQAAQARGHPEPFVVHASRVEAHHQAGRPEAVGEGVDVGGQVRAAALLAGLDEHDAARVGAAGGLDGFDGGEAGKGGIAVVRAPTPVQPVGLADRLPGPEAGAPAGHLGLLVEVAVEQHGVGGRLGRVARRGHVHHDERREAREPLDLDRQPGQVARRTPRPDELDGAVHVPVVGPGRIEGGGEIGYADVVVERRDDLLVPRA